MMATMLDVQAGLTAERGQSMTELYPRLLQKVLDHGEPVSPRGRPTLELSPFIFQLDDPRQSLVLQKARRLNRAYATVEKLALVAGVDDPSMFCFYIDRLSDFLNPATGTFDGCYGPRVAAQLPYVYNLLRADPDSRRAVISIYGRSDQHDSLDVPCTLSVQFLLRRERLSLIVNMRSSDVYLGLPYDVNQFCFLQQVMARWLGVEIGHYVHVAGSGHIYEADFDTIERVVRSGDDCLEVPAEPSFDIPFDESPNALAAFFAVERNVRADTLQPGGVGSLPECLRAPAALLQGFCRRKLCRG